MLKFTVVYYQLCPSVCLCHYSFATITAPPPPGADPTVHHGWANQTWDGAKDTLAPILLTLGGWLWPLWTYLGSAPADTS